MGATQSEIRLARLVDEREMIRNKHESKLAEVEARDDKTLTDTDKEVLKRFREESANIDIEVGELTVEIDAYNKAVEESKAVRRALQGGFIEDEDDPVVYRTMAEYARDVILTATGRTAAMIQTQLGDQIELQRAEQRMQTLKRVNNTLSSNVGGLIPPQHIAQIFQTIDASRPMIDSAFRTSLDRGTVTYPVLTTPPVVAVQASEKTAGGDTGMVIDMVTKTAVTYLGGGDLSWQAINWSTPNALDLWFQLVAADYALKTETAAATVVSAAGFLDVISSPLGASPTFAQFMTAVGAGYAKVYAESGKLANTIYMAPDRFGYILGLTSDAFTQFVDVGQAGIGPLRVVVSRGLNSGEIIVGDSQSLLVAETAGAPVELRVVEPSIGGVEVGLIGAIVTATTDDAFSLITTAS